MKCCREPRQACVASEALSQRRGMEALHAYRTVVHANIGPQLNVRQTEELEMSLNSSAGQTAAKFTAILMLVTLVPGELAAQGQPVKTASHLPVALWFIGRVFWVSCWPMASCETDSEPEPKGRSPNRQPKISTTGKAENPDATCPSCRGRSRLASGPGGPRRQYAASLPLASAAHLTPLEPNTPHRSTCLMREKCSRISRPPDKRRSIH